MHLPRLWPHQRKRWLVLYLAIFCATVGGLVLPTQIDVEDDVRKHMTCAVVTVFCLWSIGVCTCLFGNANEPHMKPKLVCFGLTSAISMVGCWVVAKPLAFELYLSVSSSQVDCQTLADFRGCLFLQPTRRACLVRLPLVVKSGSSTYPEG